jgi:hypothetical protein
LGSFAGNVLQDKVFSSVRIAMNMTLWLRLAEEDASWLSLFQMPGKALVSSDPY